MVSKNPENKMAKKITNGEMRKRVGSKGNIVQRIKERKLNLLVCKMEDNRLMKEVVFGEMERKATRGRPRKEWLEYKGMV